MKTTYRYQWILIWLALATFGFAGSILRAKYIDDISMDKAVLGGLGAVAIVTVVLVPLAIVEYFSDR
jgi:ABC-type uncharacterized transport system permease subunit